MKFFERLRRKKRYNRCRELLRVDIEIANEENAGRIENLSFGLGCGISIESGGLRKSRCELRLNSGHTFLAYNHETSDAIKEASFDAITELLEQA